VVVAALDLAVAREWGGGSAGRKQARVLLARVGWGQPDGIENEILFWWEIESRARFFVSVGN
jgi:hypothetical protein